MLGRELAAGAAALLGAERADVAAALLGARLAAADDADPELAAVPVSAAVVDGLFEADATVLMMTSAPNAMNPVSTLCLAGQDLRFCPFGACGGMADCGCHGGSWGAYC